MVIKTKRSSYGGSEFPTGRSGCGLAEQRDEIVRRHHLAAQISAAARLSTKDGIGNEGPGRMLRGRRALGR